MKKLVILSAIFLLSGCAQIRNAVFVPPEIEQYCQKISDNSDPEAMNTCIRLEQEAKEELSRTGIPPHIEKRCQQLSLSTGGSYQVLLTCVQGEIPGKRRGQL